MYSVNVLTSFTGLHPDDDEEVLPDSLPVGGTDRRPAGRSLDVAGWLGPRALLAVSSQRQHLELVNSNDHI